jgi:hypothetical protein
MKTTYIKILALLAFVACQSPKESHDHEGHDHEGHDHGQVDQHPKGTAKSPFTTAMANVGTSHVHIEYSSPSVRERVIYGGLVAFDQVWATGANNATTVSFSEDMEINGKVITKGKYALFTIPGENNWTVILNSNWDQHLADEYEEKQDVIRVNLPIKTIEPISESLTYQVQDLGSGKGVISFQWADRGFELPLANISK